MIWTIENISHEAYRIKQSLRLLCVEAGEKINGVYTGDFQVEEKEDKSPLTAADLAAHEHILKGLKALDGPLGKIPILSEEGDRPGFDQRQTWQAWWLVDPLDGTKEFVQRNGEFTVNLALIFREEQADGGLGPGIPVAGWVGAPVLDRLYEGIRGRGACRVDRAGSRAPGKDRPLPLKPLKKEGPLCIAASSSHKTPPLELIIQALEKARGPGSVHSSGSSLKFCLVAEGNAHIYPRPSPTMEWDTAAADAVCRAAKVQVVDVKNGRPLVYGSRFLKNPWFLAAQDIKLIQIARDAVKHV